MPKRIINHIKKDRALQKTISYRIIVAIVGILILGVSWIITNNPIATVLGGGLISEIVRSILFYFHEKWWENGNTRQASMD